jgi:hypothetical protein
MAKIKNDRKLTLARLKEVLRYEPDTGLFFWLVTISPKAVAGTQAGAIRKHGYRVITIDKEQHKASRLAWFYTYGELPDHLIDHENLDRADDRIVNLRKADFAENIWNTGITAANTSGFKGVARSTHGGWQASICCRGNKIHLGSFASAVDAAAAYEDAANELHGEFARFA